jgi:cephalosporin hydroxylase
VLDGVIDLLPMFEGSGPGALPAIEKFLSKHPHFTVDRKLTDRFPISHHPMGWLMRA